MSFKKIVVDQSKPFPTNKLRLEKDDGPQYPLLEFKGFGSRNTKDIEATQNTFNHRAKMCTLAAQGKWSSELENK